LNTVYIFKNGLLKRKDNTLVLETLEQGKKYIPIENISEIKIFSEIDLNKRLLEFLSSNNIPVHFFNRYGHFSGSFIPNQRNSNGCAIIKQAEYYLKPEKRLFIAKQFVSGAAKNMKQYLAYYKKRGCETAAEVEGIAYLTENIQRQENIQKVMSVEAHIRKIYYSALDKIVKYDEFKLLKRERQPPTNYMNTMISYGNSMMYSTTLTEILKTSMDPRIGYLHASNFRRYSLNLDIAEIFKPIIVDRTIISLVNRNQIKPGDFKGVQGGIHLNDSGKKKFIKEYENHLNTTIQHKKLKRKVSYKRLIRLEVYKLLKHIVEDADYIPYEMS